MACYAALLSLEQTLNVALHLDPYREICNHIPAQIIQSLQENVTSLKSFLIHSPRKATMTLEGCIRDAAYEAVDLIDNYISCQLCQKVGTDVEGFGSHVNEPEQFCQDLQQVSRKLDQILEDDLIAFVNDVKISRPSNTDNGGQPKLDGGNSSMSRDTGKDVMVGFEDEVNAVQSRLCGESMRCEIIPIIGMGGSGKTTLARHLCNSKLIKEMFDFHAWATISQASRVSDILQQLLSNVGRSSEEDDVGSMIVCLYKFLKGRKYLIILDDIWEGEAWDAVRRAFPDDNNGSRIMLTTRILQVAKHIDDSAPLCHMNLLDNHQSWTLLEKKVYGEGSSCPPELEEIGTKISRKCKGLPLAISVIAGVLSSERTLHHWKHVAENLMEALHNGRSSDDDIFYVLSLSYTHLPHHLRPCFLYLGATFLEDSSIDASQLIQLWVAEGFIESNSDSKSPEEIAEEYMEDLVKRNLVLVYGRRWDDNIRSCGIHDILREWCIKRAEVEGFITRVSAEREFREESPITKNQQRRRLAIHSNSSVWCKTINYVPQLIRTFIIFFRQNPSLMSHIIGCRLLRVLHFYDNDELDITEIFELCQLRHLAVKIDSKLPKTFEVLGSISKLFNLQTLILKNCGGYITLPVEIWGMRQLRHLICNGYFILPAPCERTVKEEGYLLPNLQTLSKVWNLTTSTKIVNMMPNVKDLGLVYYGGSISEWQEATYFQLKDINDLTNLQRLFLNLGTCSTKSDDEENKGFLWNLACLWQSLANFPVKLTTLILQECHFPWESMKAIGSLPNLEVLELLDGAFKGDEWETSYGDQFPRLKVLKLSYLGLRRWIVAESGHFPRLEKLYLYHCYNLEEISDTIGQVSTLQLIDVTFCNHFVSPWARKIQEEQESYGNYLLQVWTLDPPPPMPVFSTDRR